MKKQIQLWLVSAILLLPTILLTQEEQEFKPDFNWKGFTHMWTGMGQRDSLDAHYGFAVRYLRFQAYGKLTEKVKWATQFAYDMGKASLLDVHITYEPEEYLKLRFGQFPAPGAKAAVHSSPLWSTTKMKLNDRAMITQNWAANAGLKGYRSGGAMVFGNILDKKLHYFVMAAMPQAGPDYYFNTNVRSATYSNDENGLAMFSRIEVRPIENVEAGVNFHTGKGTVEDIYDNNRMSYTAYAMSKQEKLFFMAEYTSGNVTSDSSGVKLLDVDYSGYLLEVAYKINKELEPVIRYDSYTPNGDKVDDDGYKNYNNFTVGLNYYPSKNMALMLNYVARMEDPGDGFQEIDNDIIYFQLRFLFPTNK